MLVELGCLCENAIKLRKYMYLCAKYKLFCVFLIFYWCVMAVATLKKMRSGIIENHPERCAVESECSVNAIPPYCGSWLCFCFLLPRSQYLSPL